GEPPSGALALLDVDFERHLPSRCGRLGLSRAREGTARSPKERGRTEVGPAPDYDGGVRPCRPSSRRPSALAWGVACLLSTFGAAVAAEPQEAHPRIAGRVARP